MASNHIRSIVVNSLLLLLSFPQFLLPVHSAPAPLAPFSVARAGLEMKTTDKLIAGAGSVARPLRRRALSASRFRPMEAAATSRSDLEIATAATPHENMASLTEQEQRQFQINMASLTEQRQAQSNMAPPTGQKQFQSNLHSGLGAAPGERYVQLGNTVNVGKGEGTGVWHSPNYIATQRVRKSKGLRETIQRQSRTRHYLPHKFFRQRSASSGNVGNPLAPVSRDAPPPGFESVVRDSVSPLTSLRSGRPPPPGFEHVVPQPPRADVDGPASYLKATTKPPPSEENLHLRISGHQTALGHQWKRIDPTLTVAQVKALESLFKEPVSSKLSAWKDPEFNPMFKGQHQTALGHRLSPIGPASPVTNVKAPKPLLEETMSAKQPQIWETLNFKPIDFDIASLSGANSAWSPRSYSKENIFQQNI
ncbi:hypothetical protein H4Q26_005417 [Puccinia striiformis f. sp. tritici PST-130]|nr:hypothetical protein H4Q26_005417 [Puccinia striiformis f. sp. tritici PST-130]